MSTIENLFKKLKEKKITVSAAESCTAGYLSYLLTMLPGSSKIFKGAVIVYSLESKNKLFNIPYSLLNRTDGVCRRICIILAKNVKKQFTTDIGLSVVGFAGPKAKKGIKVGTVYIGVSYKNQCVTKKLSLKGKRNTIRQTASMKLIELLYKALSKEWEFL